MKARSPHTVTSVAVGHRYADSSGMMGALTRTALTATREVEWIPCAQGVATHEKRRRFFGGKDFRRADEIGSRGEA